MSEKEKANHYINNNEFFDAMVEWKKNVIENESCGEPKPPITEYIGECFMKIAEHLSYKPNFINYEYREEMIGDGIENCIMYAHNFDPEKSKNPFSYFTQIIYYAFLRRIEKEKKQSFVKFKLMELIDDGTLNTWFKENYFDSKENKDKFSEEEKEDVLMDHFNLNKTDIDKFTKKNKKAKKSEDSNNK
jgi:hypothetical protein